MKFIDHCEPVFQYISLLGENIADGNITYRQTKYDIEKLLDHLREGVSRSTQKMLKTYEEIRLPLLCFVDYMITNSGVPFAREWDKARLAYKENCYTGDKKFFQILDVILEDKSDQKLEALTFFRACIKFGFLGIYRDNKDIIKNYLWEINTRIPFKPANEAEKFSDSVYKNVSEKGATGSGKNYFKRCIYLVFIFAAVYLFTSFIFYYYSVNSFVATLNKTGLSVPQIQHPVYSTEKTETEPPERNILMYRDND